MQVIKFNHPYRIGITLYVRGYSAFNNYGRVSDLRPVFTNKLREAMVLGSRRFTRRMMNRIISLYDYDPLTVQKTKPTLVDK